MTIIDNSKIFLNGLQSEATVTVGANTTLSAGTILTVGTDNKIVPYTSEAPGTLGYILAQNLENSSDAAIDIAGARVFECGEVDKSKLILSNSDDTLTNELIAKLKTAGIICVNVLENTKTEV